MKIIVCVDDAYGMMFNRRRQSQDAALRERILQSLNNAKLWMNAYSAKQFADNGADKIYVDEDFLNKASEEDYCFVENVDVSTFQEQIKEITLYKWNRRYPSDFKFQISLTEDYWRLISSDEFEGSSHEKITKEVYRR
ncbi:MAG: ribonuclease Z [Ruminococcus sp.]|nr:ribonuclease Z [Ruminococcus sp.]